MLIDLLPPELVLQVLSYLPVSALSSLQSVSQAWNTFFIEYESTIYRQAAFLHGYIHNQTAPLGTQELGRRYSKRVIKDRFDWKTLCQTRIRVRNAWTGFAPSTLSAIPMRVSLPNSLSDAVHRIKVDERRGLVMTTSHDGGLFVMDMDTGKALWLLRPSYVHPYAHLEYSEGFMIFDREDGAREVWRLLDADQPTPIAEPPSTFDVASSPDTSQEEESQLAMNVALQLQYGNPPDPNSQEPFRGCFEPYALLRMQEETRAYRFVYPTLLTAARERAFLWDVPSGRAVEVLENIQRTPTDTATNPGNALIPLSFPQNNPAQVNDEEVVDTDDSEDEEEEWEDEEINEPGPAFGLPAQVPELGVLRYVDHNRAHVFLAGKYVLKVFARAEGLTSSSTESSTTTNTRSSRQLPLEIPSTKLRYGRWAYSPMSGRGTNEEGSALVHYGVEVAEKEHARSARRLVDQFKAVHVSPCGSHFVALLSGCRLLIVPHFKRFINHPNCDAELYDNTLEVQLGSPRTAMSVYLAYEEGDGGEGRVGVVTSSAVFVVILPPFALPLQTAPGIRVARVKALMNPSWLRNVSCLMMSDTGVFLNWNPTVLGYQNPFGIQDLDEDMDGGENADNEENAPGPLDSDGRRIRQRDTTRDKQNEEWEHQFEESLLDLGRWGDDCYDHLPNGDMFVVPDIRVRRSDISMVHAINMLP